MKAFRAGDLVEVYKPDELHNRGIQGTVMCDVAASDCCMVRIIPTYIPNRSRLAGEKVLWLEGHKLRILKSKPKQAKVYYKK